uniref:Uncharacterized protein n=1 Tax=Ditylenchus dipsaci TaxID=166011 RepID=A0A915EPH6_9BILA
MTVNYGCTVDCTLKLNPMSSSRNCGIRASRPSLKRELAQEVNITFNRISGLLFYDFPEYNLDKALVDCLIIVNSMALTPLVTSTHVAASKSLVLMINDAVSQVNVSTEMQYTDSDGEIRQLLASFGQYTVNQVGLFRLFEKSRIKTCGN